MAKYIYLNIRPENRIRFVSEFYGLFSKSIAPSPCDVSAVDSPFYQYKFYITITFRLQFIIFSWYIVISGHLDAVNLIYLNMHCLLAHTFRPRPVVVVCALFDCPNVHVLGVRWWPRGWPRMSALRSAYSVCSCH